MKLILVFGILIKGFLITCVAETITVGLEPFPPFVDEYGKGLTINMLNAIEEISDLEFDIQIMTYARAKNELKYQRINIAGHTPKDSETDAFYDFAEELNWQIHTTSVLFSFKEKYLNIDNVKPRTIGTTTGNAIFLAEQLGIDPSLFVEVRTLNQLVDMFIARRIDVITFERASVMTLLSEKNIFDVYYKTIGSIPASMAVHKGKRGAALKAKIDGIIEQLDLDKIFSGYLHYINLPDNGKTSIAIEKQSH